VSPIRRLIHNVIQNPQFAAVIHASLYRRMWRLFRSLRHPRRHHVQIDIRQSRQQSLFIQNRDALGRPIPQSADFHYSHRPVPTPPPDRAGHASAQSIMLSGRSLQCLRVVRIQQAIMPRDILNARRMHGQTASILIGNRSMSQRILRSHRVPAATGVCRGPDFASSIRASLLTSAQIIGVTFCADFCRARCFGSRQNSARSVVCHDRAAFFKAIRVVGIKVTRAASFNRIACYLSTKCCVRCVSVIAPP